MWEQNKLYVFIQTWLCCYVFSLVESKPESRDCNTFTMVPKPKCRFGQSLEEQPNDNLRCQCFKWNHFCSKCLLFLDNQHSLLADETFMTFAVIIMEVISACKLCTISQSILQLLHVCVINTNEVDGRCKSPHRKSFSSSCFWLMVPVVCQFAWWIRGYALILLFCSDHASKLWTPLAGYHCNWKSLLLSLFTLSGFGKCSISFLSPSHYCGQLSSTCSVLQDMINRSHLKGCFHCLLLDAGRSIQNRQIAFAIYESCFCCFNGISFWIRCLLMPLSSLMLSSHLLPWLISKLLAKIKQSSQALSQSCFFCACLVIY